jgi:hypothetical protein
MRTWTAAAREELERYFGRVGPALVASGADANEVIDDLRRHLEQEAAASELQVVTEQDVRRLLARIGAPEPPMSGPSPSEEPRPSSPDSPPRPGLGGLARVLVVAFGLVLPVIALLIEWITGICAGAFFDPIPSLWHLLLVGLVPSTNWLLWRAVRRSEEARTSWAGWMGGLAVGVEVYYALVFLPLMLPGLLAIIFYGWGLLPLSPTLALIVTLYLMRLARLRLAGPHRTPAASSLPGAWAGFALGLAALLLLEAPEALTRYGLTLATSEEPASARRGIDLLRTWGDREVLLRDCYGRTRAAENMDLMAWVVTGGRSPQPDQAREIYYRVTGQPFNSVPAPKVRTGRARWAGLDDWTWDRDQAGQQVGGRLKGLTLHSSRLDALVEADAAIAYCEWTMEFKNDSARQREARAQILLPPGGVVSRVTLWVNGEEREAAFAGRGQVRAAYEKVVRRRQDPVLVTTAGPDRILVQCFPIPPDGGIMKVRLGITAPLALASPEQGLMRWPHLIERNFTIQDAFGHSLWVEAQCPLTNPGGLLRTEQPKPGWHAVRAQARETELASSTTRIEVRRDGTVREAWVRDVRGAEAGLVRQSLSETRLSRPQRVVVVVDGTLGMVDLPAVAGALAELPAGIETSVIVASDDPVLLGALAGAPDTRNRLATWEARGGQDNLPALVQAWDLAAEKPESLILWIHGPVPVMLQSAEALRQRYERRPEGPRLLEFQTQTGPNRILEQLDGLVAVESLPRTADSGGDLRSLFRSWAGQGRRWEWVRQRVSDAAGVPSGAKEASLHLARLWAKNEIGRLAASRKTEAAVDLAGRYQLVTPISGAVVLETAQQYRESGLEPVPASSVPSIPEPSTGILLALGAGVLLFVRRRRG